MYECKSRKDFVLGGDDTSICNTLLYRFFLIFRAWLIDNMVVVGSIDFTSIIGFSGFSNRGEVHHALRIDLGFKHV